MCKPTTATILNTFVSVSLSFCFASTKSKSNNSWRSVVVQSFVARFKIDKGEKARLCRTPQMCLFKYGRENTKKTSFSETIFGS